MRFLFHGRAFRILREKTEAKPDPLPSAGMSACTGFSVRAAQPSRRQRAAEPAAGDERPRVAAAGVEGGCDVAAVRATHPRGAGRRRARAAGGAGRDA